MITLILLIYACTNNLSNTLPVNNLSNKIFDDIVNAINLSDSLEVQNLVSQPEFNVFTVKEDKTVLDHAFDSNNLSNVASTINGLAGRILTEDKAKLSIFNNDVPISHRLLSILEELESPGENNNEVEELRSLINSFGEQNFLAMNLNYSDYANTTLLDKLIENGNDNGLFGDKIDFDIVLEKIAENMVLNDEYLHEDSKILIDALAIKILSGLETTQATKGMLFPLLKIAPESAFNVLDEENNTPLMLALKRRPLDKNLLKSIILKTTAFTNINKDNETTLMIALKIFVDDEDKEIIEGIISKTLKNENGIELIDPIQNDTNQTALTIALGYIPSQIGIIDTLVELSTNFDNLVNDSNVIKTPLMIALDQIESEVEIIKKIVSKTSINLEEAKAKTNNPEIIAKIDERIAEL